LAHRGRAGTGDLGSVRLRLRVRRRAGHRASRPVAPGPAERDPRPLRGRAGRVPGARLRPREPDLDPRGDGLDRGRPADGQGDGGGRARVRAPHARRRADRGGDLHAQPRRPLRRRGRARAGRSRQTRRAARDRARRLPRGRDQRERAGRHRPGPAPARGTIGILRPTELVDHTSQELEIDGVRFVFQYVPDSEAPTELTFYLPEKKAWCAAEIATHTLHNLYTLRGAPVRDALRWSGYLDEAMRLFSDAEVVFASHHWPVWGRERVREYLAVQRDTYKYLHDQTLRLANQGLTPREIAEKIELPASLRRGYANRDYYGTVRHDVKAVYQRYFGWYDGNPANLDPLPPTEIAARYVEAMGGRDAVLAKGREAQARGDHRWAATLLDHLVFAFPDDAVACAALAETYDQLGHGAEPGPWRDAYLPGAYELRHGTPKTSPVDLAASLDLLRETPLDSFFAALAARLDGPNADGERATFNFGFTDAGDTPVPQLATALPHHRRGDPAPDAAATVRLTRELLVRLAAGEAGLRELVFSDELAVEGSRLALLNFLRRFDRPAGAFPIVTP